MFLFFFLGGLKPSSTSLRDVSRSNTVTVTVFLPARVLKNTLQYETSCLISASLAPAHIKEYFVAVTFTVCYVYLNILNDECRLNFTKLKKGERDRRPDRIAANIRRM